MRERKGHLQMEFLLNSDEMKKCDQVTSEYFKIPSICLMERAAVATVEEIIKRVSKSENILIIAGSGNNGGDAFATGRMLYVMEYNVSILFVGNIDKVTEQTKMQLDILNQYKIPVVTDIHNINFSSYSCIIDGIFGVGINRDITGDYKAVIEKINEHTTCVPNKTCTKVFSIDIPSGINTDNGNVMGCAVKADYTVTFAFKKAGQYLYPGSDYCGEIILRDIGITSHSFLDNTPDIYTYNSDDLKRMLPVRKNNSNKGSFGKVTMFVGSVDMAGAAYLAATSALRTGVGYVRIVTPKENRVILQTLIPEAVLTTYDKDNLDENTFKNIIETSSVILCGCGLGTKTYSLQLLQIILKYCKKNLVLDADALNLIAQNCDLYNMLPQDTIITPHLGEMSRLCEMSISQIKKNLQNTAHSFAEQYKVCCVLKDARTFVSMKGHKDYMNIHGCNGMSTAGSGDVLAGIISGLLALNMNVKDAADYGVLLHSLAGESAALKYGNHSMLAGNISEEISSVLRKITT